MLLGAHNRECDGIRERPDNRTARLPNASVLVDRENMNPSPSVSAVNIEMAAYTVQNIGVLSLWREGYIQNGSVFQSESPVLLQCEQPIRTYSQLIDSVRPGPLCDSVNVFAPWVEGNYPALIG